MIKRIPVGLLLFLLIACAPNDQWTKVSLAHSEVIGQINLEFFNEFEDKESVETFKSLFENAVQQEGIVDISNPDYDVVVVDDEGKTHEMHLWIGESDEKSALMWLDDTNTIYLIPEDGTKQLIELVEPD